MLKKTLGILAGPIGWVITGALVSINLAGPAYRVTVPACVLIATLRRKPKQINKPKIDNKKGGKGIFQAITQAIAQKAVLKNSKILATRIKEWQHRSKTQNHSKHKNNKGAEIKER